MLMPWLTVPQIVHEVFKSQPPALAHIVLPKPEIVIPPPPPPVQQEALPQPEIKEVKPPEPKKPQPVLEKQPIVKQPTVADAREKAAVSGLLQFKDSFADRKSVV